MVAGETTDSFVVVAEAVSAVTRKGDPYLKLSLRDRNRSANCFVWSNRPDFEAVSRIRPGEVCKIRGRLTAGDDGYGPKLELDQIRRADPARDSRDYSPADLFETTRFDVNAMWIELNAIIAEHVRDTPIRLLTAELLRRREAEFKSAPAAERNHHAYLGGLLEHTLSVTRLCVHLADKYSEYYRGSGVPVDKDLVVAGGCLHDIGKVVELDLRPGVTGYTTPGRLVGHIVIGRDMVREVGAAIPGLDPRKLMLLEHIILSHQGRKEWSSPVEPRTLEALLVHYADDIDAKANMFVEAVLSEPPPPPLPRGSPPDGEHTAPADDAGFTGRKNVFGRELFRGL
jgi:3'-5' exoribonuclease